MKVDIELARQTFEALAEAIARQDSAQVEEMVVALAHHLGLEFS
jgi:hypothetical protein